MDKFSGFTSETLQFFIELENNNEKLWFNENRYLYDEFVYPQAQAFTLDMGQRLRQEVAPDIQAIPKTDKSIFRLHRDVRFSKDKSPYKTHLGIFLWEGPGKKMECPGFYFQLSAEGIMFGVGMHIFPKPFIPVYREAVAKESKAAKLSSILQNLAQKPNFVFKEKRYKKTPRGFDPDYKYSDLLLYDGVAVMWSSPITNIISSAEFMGFAFDKFKTMAPLHQWFLKLLNEAG